MTRKSPNIFYLLSQLSLIIVQQFISAVKSDHIFSPHDQIEISLTLPLICCFRTAVILCVACLINKENKEVLLINFHLSWLLTVWIHLLITFSLNKQFSMRNCLYSLIKEKVLLIFVGVQTCLRQDVMQRTVSILARKHLLFFQKLCSSYIFSLYMM